MSMKLYHCPVKPCEYKGFNRYDLQRHLLLIHNKNSFVDDLKRYYEKI